jgi:stage V sporulation protein D (sporulation-specific penicillin-binding protein)
LSGPSLFIKKRFMITMAAFSVCIVILIIRLGWLQILQGNWYQKKAYEQQTTGRLINPKRGTIFDRNGNILAISASVEKISIKPKQFRDSIKDANTAAQELADILGIKKEDVLKRINRKKD